MRSITIGELKEIFDKYPDESEVYLEYEGGISKISFVNPVIKPAIMGDGDEIYLVLE